MKGVTIEQLRKAFRYDPETGLIYSLSNKRPADKPIGTKKSHGYLVLVLGPKYLLAHRVAWALHYGEWPASVLDHIDRDRVNNRISNLRLATVSQNTQHSLVKGSIPAKGVTRDKGGRRFMARIYCNGKCNYLGTFGELDEAAHAYNKAAIALHGEFAVLNPIGQDKQ